MNEQTALKLLNSDEVPKEMPLIFQAIWQALHDNWDNAHAIAQDDTTDIGAWVHAWLHRIEGDTANAAYWYRRAARPVFTGLIEDEGREIAAVLLSKGARS